VPNDAVNDPIPPEADAIESLELVNERLSEQFRFTRRGEFDDFVADLLLDRSATDFSQ
jgi:hypothetical protein